MLAQKHETTRKSERRPRHTAGGAGASEQVAGVGANLVRHEVRRQSQLCQAVQQLTQSDAMRCNRWKGKGATSSNMNVLVLFRN